MTPADEGILAAKRDNAARVQHWIAVDPEHTTIYGLGHTQAEAIEDARTREAPDAYRWDETAGPEGTGDWAAATYLTIRATARLYERVERDGAAGVRWTTYQHHPGETRARTTSGALHYESHAEEMKGALMINNPTAGIAPDGRAITDKTPNRPGFFLSRDAAESFLGELPAELRDRYSIERRSVLVAAWTLTFWVAVPREWISDPGVEP